MPARDSAAVCRGELSNDHNLERPLELGPNFLGRDDDIVALDCRPSDALAVAPATAVEESAELRQILGFY